MGIRQIVIEIIRSTGCERMGLPLERVEAIAHDIAHHAAKKPEFHRNRPFFQTTRHQLSQKWFWVQLQKVSPTRARVTFMTDEEKDNCDEWIQGINDDTTEYCNELMERYCEHDEDGNVSVDDYIRMLYEIEEFARVARRKVLAAKEDGND